MKNNMRGFTLIEIVMVLVLLGILAAVAIPKYYDLKTQAERQTAKAVAAEYQARLNAKFAELILDGQTCSTAREGGVGEANELFTADSADAKAHGFTADFSKITTAAKDASTASATLTITKGKEPMADVTIALPVCSSAPALKTTP